MYTTLYYIIILIVDFSKSIYKRFAKKTHPLHISEITQNLLSALFKPFFRTNPPLLK